MLTVLWFNWKMPAASWLLSEGFWVLELGRGSLEREIAEVWISRQKMLQVFEVVGLVCEEDEG